MRERSSLQPALMAVDAGGLQRPLSRICLRRRYARSADDIDFRRLAGKRVGVLGAGASAFRQCRRRARSRRQLGSTFAFAARKCLGSIRSSGRISRAMLGHFARTGRSRALAVHAPHSGGASGASNPRWLFGGVAVLKILRGMPIARGKPVREAAGVANGRNQSSHLRIRLHHIWLRALRPTFRRGRSLPRSFHHIALWRDRFTPPPGEESDLLARHPYLGSAFEFTEREPGTAPFLSRLHNFTFGAMPSLGLTGVGHSWNKVWCASTGERLGA